MEYNTDSGKVVFVMAIVITNGKYYVAFDVFFNQSQNSGIKKTKDISEAYNFTLISDAIRVLKRSCKKTKGYYVFDTLRNHVIWKRMSQEELIQAQEEKLSKFDVKRDSNGKIKRKKYSQDTRKLIYNRAGCRCELCGRNLLFEDVTIDHVIPLSKGGIDNVENLACVCYEDNQFKNNILPEDFLERITKIFLYQMEKKNGNSVKWKIVYRMLKRMV